MMEMRLSFNEIARQLGRHRSTIRRELGRNRSAAVAHHAANTGVPLASGRSRL
jgi:IS30 family transposase